MKRGGGLLPARPDWWPPNKAAPGNTGRADRGQRDCLGGWAPVLVHVPSFGSNPRGSPDFLAYPVPKACMHVLGTGVPRCFGVARSASSPKAAQALGCSLTPGLRISFAWVTCMARAASVPRLWKLGILLLRGACVWVWVVVGFGFRLRPATLAWGVGVCVCLCVCSACTQPLLARGRGVGVCVWTRVSAASRHSWLGCSAVCVPRLHPATPGTGARCGCACLGFGFGCAPPLLAGVLGCACAPLAPSHSWPRVRCEGVCVSARLSAAPRHSWLGCWAVCVLRLHPATPGTGARCGCVCLGSGFGCAQPLLAGVLGCVYAPLAPCHSLPRVRGVGVCVLARVSAAPRHSWLGCWAVCVLRLHPATPGTGARCGCGCLGSGFGCAPPLQAGVLGCVCAPLAPSHSWPRVRGVGVCVWARLSAAPRHCWLGCWAVCVLRLHPASPGHGCAVRVCVFGLGFRLRPTTPGWGVGLCACSACSQPLLATGARCGCACLGSGFGCAPPLLAGVLGCVCAPLAPSHSWPRVRGVVVCVWAPVPAAPRHSWLGCRAVCLLRLHPATPGHGCAVWVCVFGLGFQLRPATPGWGVGLCACSACTHPLSARLRGVGVCVWARVSAAPRHSWLGCWAVCVLRLHPATPGDGCAVWVCLFGLGSRLRPATPGGAVGLCVCSACTQPLQATGARCGCVCLGSAFGCAPPLLAGVLGCVRAPLAPSLSWPRVRAVGVRVWARVSAAPRHSWLGCWAVCVLRLHPATPGNGCAV